MGSGISARKVLIIDDDKLWRGVMSGLFQSAGYGTAAAATCREGLALAASERPDCVLLDFHLGDGDGGQVCAGIRASGALRKTPVVMVSADPAEEINSYSLYGADGFILKGCSFEKIRAVVESVLRRVEMERGCLEAGDLRLEPEGCRVLRQGHSALVLPPEQFRLFSLLFERSPRCVGEEEISRRVLGASGPADRTDQIRSLVYRLRRSLGTQLSLRVRNESRQGWAYVPPRDRQ